ncbi:MAG TPA: VTT domain-containing protein [Thermoanaerobaculia bacterium]|nr:VTT domain-containing protein [Thermoanaerobaculia bacterium]
MSAETRLTQTRRAAALLLLLAAIVALVSLDSTWRAIHAAIAWADAIVAAHQVAGPAVFLVLSALSAMVAFFSTAVVVPVAIDAWGKLLTVLLLWIGWLAGGMLSYCIGRYFGRGVVRWFISDETLRPYEERARGIASFSHVLLFQFALPSEVPGYVLGLLGVPFRIYAAALAITELPFAIGAVYLGESFLQRNIVLLLALGVAGIGFTLLAASVFHRLFASTKNVAQPSDGDAG